MAELRLPVSAAQDPTDLDSLATTVRTAHAAAGHAASNFLEHALTAGDALIAAQGKLDHGQWGDWLRCKCDLKERTAQRYMQLARGRAALEANPTRVSDLSLRSALKLVGAVGTPRPKETKLSKRKKPVTSFDAIAWWGSASLEERRHFLDSIGRNQLFEAIPESCAKIEDEPADLIPATDNLTGNDPGPFPECLKRRPSAATPSPPPALPVVDAERLVEIDAEILATRRAAEHRHIEPSEWRRVDRLRQKRAALEKPQPLLAAPWRLERGLSDALDHAARRCDREPERSKEENAASI